MKFIAIITLTIFFLSCSLSNSGDKLTTEEKALISLMVRDYSLQERLSYTGSLEADDLSESAGYESSSSSTARTISTASEELYVLDDGTELLIIREIEDGDTTDTTSDDELTVSRFYYYDEELWKTEEIIRPLKPESSWDLWENDQLLQEGSLKVLIGANTIATGSIQALWSLDSNGVVLEEVHKSSFNIISNIKRVTDMVFDGDQVTQRISKLHWNGSELVEIAVFTTEILQIDGESYTKLHNDDGSYILIKQKSSPQVREYYDDQGNLYMVETIGKNGGLRSEVTRDFYEEGILKDSKVVSISYKIGEDSVKITKKVDTDMTKFIIEISEIPDGYLIERKGNSYTVSFSDYGSVLIYSDSGEFLAEIMTRPDDSATVTESDGTTTTFNF